MDELLTITEVAQELKLNSRTVRRFVQRGELPVTPEGPLRVRRSDLTTYLNARSTPASRPLRRPQRRHDALTASEEYGG